MTRVLCADVGGSFIRLGVSPHAGEVRPRGEEVTPAADWPGFVAAFGRLVRGDDAPLAVATAGLVDDDGRVAAANIACYAGRRVAAELAAALHRPVLVANDADCFALAEAQAGAGRGHRVVFAAILGTGVGGGLVVDGRLVPGAGEWGHGPIARMSPRLACGCGQSGCADTVGGARGLERLHAHLTGETAGSREILDQWRAGSTRTVPAWLDLVSEPLALVVNATNASIVPVGGGLGADAGLVAALDEAVRARILRRPGRPLVVPGERRADGGLMGAAVLAHAAWG